jgi:hypothetical protein
MTRRRWLTVAETAGVVVVGLTTALPLSLRATDAAARGNDQY